MSASRDPGLSFAHFCHGLRPLRDELRVDLCILRRLDSTHRAGMTMIGRRVGPRPIAIAAWEQTAGRGRFPSRGWDSPPGVGIYSSWCQFVPTDRVGGLSLAIGIALAEGLEKSCGAPLQLKWPNDLLLEGRKVGGVLVEGTSQGGNDSSFRMAAGWGINVRPGAHSPQATCLMEASSFRELSLAELSRACFRSVVREVEFGPRGGALRDRVVARMVHQAGDTLRVENRGETVEGEYQGLDESGALLLKTARGTSVVASGELGEARLR